MKNLLLIEHGGKFKRFTIEKLAQQGMVVYIACTQKPDWLEGLVQEENYILTDTYNSIVMLESVLAHLAVKNINLDGVGTFWESCVVQAADVAEALSLPNIGAGASRRSSQNKLLMRQWCSQAGIAMPAYTVANLNDYHSLEKAAEKIGYPFIIKPLYGSSSYGVVKVENKNGLRNACTNSKISITAENEEIFKLFKGYVLVEQYVSGNLLSVDGIVQNNVPQFAGITEFLMGTEPYFTQIGSIIRPLSPEFYQPLYNYTQQIITTLGFVNGAFHCELRVDNGKPTLIEIAARMPGGPIALGYEKAFGIDLVSALANIWTGETATLQRSREDSSLHKCIFPNIAKNATLQGVSGYEQAKSLPALWNLIPITQAGESLKTYPEVPTPVYYYAVSAKSEKFLLQASEQVESVIQFTTI